MKGRSPKIKFKRKSLIVPVLLLLFCFLILSFGVRPAVAKNEDLLSMHFIDNSRGWLCGRWGTVMSTQDGGRTWLPQKTDTDFTLSAICFSNENIGAAVGDEGTIIYTEDGGRIWKKAKSPVKYFLMDISFISEKVGFIVTEQTTILKTADGGKSWQIAFQDEDFILKSISFSDPLNGWTVGEYGYIYKTRDGGNTWTHQAGFYDISDETGDIEGEAYLFDIQAIDEQNAWAVGIDGIVKYTNDGGNSWESITSELPKTPFFSVTSDKAGSVVIVGDGVVLSTVNQGETWERVSLDPGFPYGWLYHVSFIPQASVSQNGLFIACGQGGVVYRGGSESWKQILPKAKKNIIAEHK